MVSALTNFWLSFLAGLFAPLGAVCVLPLYPGFLAYLSSKVTSKDKNPRKKIILFGVIVTLGVLLSLFLVGLIFTKILSVSLSNAISVISPIAFGILAVVSILMIFNVNIGAIFPKAHAPVTKNPYLSALIFGLFFGAIVLPCNPASLAILFAVSTSTLDFLTNLINFILFGIGMSLPLLILAIISATSGQAVLNFLTKHTRKINLYAGIIMLAISLYYIFFVFKVI